MTETLYIGRSAVAWAREHGEHFAVHTHTDNYEPPRSSTTLTIHRFQNHFDETSYVLEDGMNLPGTPNAGFLLDDGHTVTALYVASWHQEHRYLILHQFPMNFHPTGEPKMRADRQEQVDHSTWMLGPRRYYHLKVVS